jgi:hypothetical protein
MRNATLGCAAILLWLLAGCSPADKTPAAAVDRLAAAAGSPGHDSCPLSPADQRRAVADFHKMMPAIASPRCANCHGGIDVFAPSAKDLHGGGQIEMKCGVDKQAEEFGLGSERICVADYSMCGYCHYVDGWQLPPEDRNFAGRTPVEICNQFRTIDDANVIRQHVIDDPLVLAGFIGKRGRSLATVPKPPPISHEEFQAAALDWLSLVSHDGRFYTGKDCGCVASVPRLRITDHLLDSTDRYGVERDLTYRADLALDEDGDDYTGSGTYSGTLVTRKVNCHNDAPEDREVHQLQGAFDATASFREIGGGKGMANYNFDTLDWPVDLVPFAMMGVGNDPKAIADATNMAHHMGSTLGLMLETTGPHTVIHTHKVDDGRGSHMSGCVGSATHDEDITIEVIAHALRP